MNDIITLDKGINDEDRFESLLSLYNIPAF